jgi:hypothetical protein
VLGVEDGFQEGYNMDYKMARVRVLMMALSKLGGKASLLMEEGKRKNASVNNIFQ